MNIPEIEPIAGAVSAQIERAAQAAYDELLRLIDAGTDPRRAVEQVLTTFNGAYVTALSEAFSQVMQQRVTPSSVLAMPVGEVYLSARLYDAVQQTQGEVSAIVKQHAQGLHDARQLARRLYDGYNPQDGIQRPLEGSARAYLPRALRELTANPAARQSLQQVLEQMQAQAGRLKSEALKAGYMELLDAWAKGKGREVLQKRLWVAQREKTRYMADRIAQTELARAYTDRVAGQIMADETVEVVQVRLNPRHPLPDICDLHAKANLWGLGPGLYPKGMAPKPPFHPHCLTGDALITASGRITAVSKRWFDGDVVVITTASGKRLTATINHPILTSVGWVRAGLLNVGDDVISRVVTESVGADVVINDQHQNVPTSIAEIANAFLCSSEVAARKVPVAAEDFHGDGVASKVAVIGANRKLWDRVDATTTQGRDNQPLVLTSPGMASLFGDSVLDLVGERLWHAAYSIMRGLGHGGAPLRAYALKTDDVLLPLGAQNNSGFNEPLGDSWSGDAELARQIQNGATGPVFPDKVTGINRHAFSGHVYNLETERGHYTGNNIVTHNCWCRLSTRPDLSATQAQAREDGAREWLRTLPPADAARVLGNRDRLDMVLAGADWEKVTQAVVRADYRLQRLGAVSSSPMIQTRVANQQEIEAFMAGTLERSIPVGLVPKDIKEHLGTSADVVLFSRYTADKQRKHPEITADSFSWLQELLDNGARLYDKKHHATVIQHREQPYLAVLKSTSDGSEVYLQSFRRTDEKNLASLAKRVGGS